MRTGAVEDALVATCRDLCEAADARPHERHPRRVQPRLQVPQVPRLVHDVRAELMHLRNVAMGAIQRERRAGGVCDVVVHDRRPRGHADDAAVRGDVLRGVDLVAGNKLDAGWAAVGR